MTLSPSDLAAIEASIRQAEARTTGELYCVVTEESGEYGETPLAWAAWFYQTFVVAFASYLAWVWLIQRHAASRIAGFTFLTPLFGILAGVLLLGERFSPWVLVGLAAIAVGLRLLTRPPGARRRTRPA